MLIFGDLNLVGDGGESWSFTIISIGFLLLFERKYFLQVYLENCAYKTVDKRLIDYVYNHLFDSDPNYFLNFWWMDLINVIWI